MVTIFLQNEIVEISQWDTSSPMDWKTQELKEFDMESEGKDMATLQVE
jgi:hypothetical protein